MAYVASAIVGGGLLAAGGTLGGAAMSADSAEGMQKGMLRAANQPPLDFGALTSEAQAAQRASFLGAESLAMKTGLAGQRTLNAQQELAMPGASGAQSDVMAAIRKLFGSDVDWMNGLQSRGAAIGIGRFGGGAGSGASQIGTLRMSNQEQMQRWSIGSGMLTGLLSSMRLAQTPSISAFMAPPPSALIEQRSKEQSMRAGQQFTPGSGAVWGNALSQVGGMAAGITTQLGMNSLMAGRGGIGQTTGGVPRNVYGTSGILGPAGNGSGQYTMGDYAGSTMSAPSSIPQYWGP